MEIKILLYFHGIKTLFILQSIIPNLFDHNNISNWNNNHKWWKEQRTTCKPCVWRGIMRKLKVLMIHLNILSYINIIRANTRIKNSKYLSSGKFESKSKNI